MKKTYYYFLAIFLVSQVFVLQAAPKVTLLPSQNAILGDDEVHFTIVLDAASTNTTGEELNDGTAKLMNKSMVSSVNNVHSIVFDITASVPNLVVPTMVMTNNSWLGQPNDLQVFSTNNGLTNDISGTLPNTVTVGRSDVSNTNGFGQVALLGCIITIDDLFRMAPPVDPTQPQAFTITLSNIELVTKVDLSTADIMPTDIRTPVPDASATVYFSPKCNLTSLHVATQCSADSTTFNATLSFGENTGGNTYSVTDNLTTTYANVVAGTYTFSNNYPSGTALIFSVTNNVTGDVCSILADTDCSNPIPAPTCNDNIQNQDETGLDCGGSSCPPCLSCDMQATITTECISGSQFEVTVNVSGSASLYNIVDELGDSRQVFGSGSQTFIYNYPAINSMDIEVSTNPTCSTTLNAAFKNCICNYIPTNDECTYGTPLNIGSNGPFNNYCTTASNPSPNCLNDAFTHTAWYTFTGTGGDLSITAYKCNPVMSDYNGDLTMAIYSDCNLTSQIACSDDVLFLQPSTVIPNTIAGQSYHIVIDGYGSYDPTGEYCLHICTPLACSVAVNPTSCVSQSEGTINITMTSGTSPYSFRWSNGNQTEDLNNVPSGTYQVTVFDDNACSCQSSITVSPDPNSINMSLVSNSTANFNTNNTLLEVSNGTPPYNYSWNTVGYVRQSAGNNATGGVDINIIYQEQSYWAVTVTDDNGCQTWMSNNSTNLSNILDIADFLVIPESEAPITANGLIDITIEGGTTPYFYQWSNGSTNQDINNLSSGWYSVTVSDSSTPPQEALGWYWVPRQSPGRSKDIATSPQNYFSLHPNPIQTQGILDWQVAESGFAQIQLFDINGRQVATLFEGNMQAGQQQQISFDTQNLNDGLYICILNMANGYQTQQRLVVSKE